MQLFKINEVAKSRPDRQEMPPPPSLAGLLFPVTMQLVNDTGARKLETPPPKPLPPVMVMPSRFEGPPPTLKITKVPFPLTVKLDGPGPAMVTVVEMLSEPEALPSFFDVFQ